MKTALIGTGKIGNYLLNYLRHLNSEIDTYDKPNLSDLENTTYEVIFLTTPMKAVEEVREKIKNEPIVITTIKGIYNNKIVADFFERVISLNGYYTPSTFKPSVCHENTEDLVNSLFPDFQKLEVSIKEALIANYLKNMYLVVSEKVGEKRVFEDICKLKIDKKIKKLLLEDILKSKEFRSRNYMFSKLVYVDKWSVDKALANLGLVEGAESFVNSTQFYSNFLTKIREEFIKDMGKK